MSDFPDSEVIHCNGCAQVLQTWERFCPHCGVDQFAKIYGGRLTDTPAEPDHPPPAETVEPAGFDFMHTQPPSSFDDVAEPPRPVDPIPLSTASERSETDAGIGVAHVADRGITQERGPNPLPHIVMGILLGIFLALAGYIGLTRHYFEAGGQQAFRSDLSLLWAARPGATAGAATPAAAPPPGAAIAPTPPVTPVTSAPPTPPAAGKSGAAACSDALKALALCDAN